VCEFCGRKGRAVVPDATGRGSILDLGQGWAVAPYPPELVHHDGSAGDLFTCPTCRALLSRGDTLTSRAYLRRPVVHEFAAAGMSTRAIAPVVGTSFKTVARDVEAPVSGDTRSTVNTETGEVSDDHEGALRAAERTKSALRERGAID
jgi:hypothetical protein